MLLLFETAAGYALFKVLDEDYLKSADNEATIDINRAVALQSFKHFRDTTEALEACSALVESKLGKSLKSFLKKEIVKKDLAESENLVVLDSKVAGSIKKKLGITCTSSEATNAMMRCIRAHLDSLLEGPSGVEGHSDLATSALGLAHSFSRYKLKFSPEKVDTMIVQAVSLLDDLDKEINTYCMRVREWYGWHFPELSKIITENATYCRLAQRMRMRAGIPSVDLSDLVPEELETEIKELSQVSMGTDISEEDMDNISALCQQVLDIAAYREQLWDYLRSRMAAIAPNLSTLVGELVGARLIAHTGSLIALAKYPASTIQILGAEKALFRALKTKKKTPKYGLIYHASLIGQAPTKGKGQISRVLAAKAALCARVDALAEAAPAPAQEAKEGEEAAAAEEAVSTAVGLEGRTKVEMRIRNLEGAAMHAGAGKKQSALGAPQKYNNKMDGGFNRKTGSFDTSKDSTYGKRGAPVTEGEAPAKKIKKF